MGEDFCRPGERVRVEGVAEGPADPRAVETQVEVEGAGVLEEPVEVAVEVVPLTPSTSMEAVSSGSERWNSIAPR